MNKDIHSLCQQYKLVAETAVYGKTNNIANAQEPGAMKIGTISLVDKNNVVLGTYTFRNGGAGRGYIPAGTYMVGPEEQLDKGEWGPMSVGSEGWKFRVFNSSGGRKIPDSRVNNVTTTRNPAGGPRDGILIHPDGGGPGTEGCIGIVGDQRTQADFRQKMNLLIKQNGGRYPLKFDAGTFIQEPQQTQTIQPSTLSQQPQLTKMAPQQEPLTATKTPPATTYKYDSENDKYFDKAIEEL